MSKISRLTKKELLDKQAVVRNYIQLKSEGMDAKDKMFFLLGELSQVQEEKGVDILLHSFFCALAALLHFEHYEYVGSLRMEQVAETAEAILKILRIRFFNSPLSFLYSQLNSAHAQVIKRTGNHFRSYFKHQLAIECAFDVDNRFMGHYRFSLANRLLRRGDIESAIAEYQKAISLGLSEEQRGIAEICRLSALRLLGRWEEHAQNIAELESVIENQALLLEIRWENHINKLHATGDLGAMLSAIGKQGDHNGGGYILEAVLWGIAFGDSQIHKRLPDIATLRGNNTKKFRPWKDIAEIVIAIQNLTVATIPLYVRLQRFGDIVGASTQVISLNYEILSWLAASKALGRIKQDTLAAAAEFEYNALCLRASRGKSSDLLKLRS